MMESSEPAGGGESEDSLPFPTVARFEVRYRQYLATHGLMTLLAPVYRVTGYDTVMPLPKLERQYMPSTQRILDTARRALDYT